MRLLNFIIFASVVFMLWMFPPLLSLKVSPQACLAPCTVTLNVRVERDEQNRRVEVVVDGENFYRSTSIQLDGVEAAITQAPIIVKNVPAGQYEVTAALWNSVREIERRRTSLSVSGDAQQMRKK